MEKDNEIIGLVPAAGGVKNSYNGAKNKKTTDMFDDRIERSV